MFAKVYMINSGARKADVETLITNEYKTMSGLLRAVEKKLGKGAYILDLYQDKKMVFLGPTSTRRVLFRDGQPPLVR